MAYNSGDLITLADFQGLKNLITAECNRRKYTGSVASYATSNPFSSSKGSVITTSDGNTLYIPLKAINGSGLTAPAKGGNIQLSTYLDLVQRLSAIAIDSSSHGCSASCTGLCSTNCGGNCTGGCGGTCQGCSGSCSGCSGGCSGCSGSCQGACKGSCTGCGSSCYWGGPCS